MQLVGDGGDEPHDHEFGGADRKGTQGEGQTTPVAYKLLEW